MARLVGVACLLTPFWVATTAVAQKSEIDGRWKVVKPDLGQHWVFHEGKFVGLQIFGSPIPPVPFKIDPASKTITYGDSGAMTYELTEAGLKLNDAKDMKVYELVRDEEKLDADLPKLAGNWKVMSTRNPPARGAMLGLKLELAAPEPYVNKLTGPLTNPTAKAPAPPVAQLTLVPDSSQMPPRVTALYGFGPVKQRQVLQLAGVYEFREGKLVLVLGPANNPPAEMPGKVTPYWVIEFVRSEMP